MSTPPSVSFQISSAVVARWIAGLAGFSTVSYTHLDVYKRQVQAAIAERLPGVAVDVSSVGVYQAQDDPAHKTITLHVECSSYEKTLSDSELNAVLDYAADRASEALGAVRT